MDLKSYKIHERMASLVYQGGVFTEGSTPFMNKGRFSENQPKSVSSEALV
jgi:hypothetical protein